MRQVVGISLALLGLGAAGAFVACSSSTSSGFPMGGGDSGIPGFHPTDGSTARGEGGIVNPGSDGGILQTHDSGLPPPDGSVTMTSKTTIYAHTDTELYSMDPSTMAITDVGTFTGMGGSYYDTTITDLAVDAAGDVYVNSEQMIYKATLPATPGPGAKVQLTLFLNTDPTLADGGTLTTKYYALAFTPPNTLPITTLPTGETLIGGDSNGEVWAIPATGPAVDVGNFGADPSNASNFLSVSGDLVFYTSGSTPTGLATIRSCSKSSSTGKVTCTKTNDYLAGINMTNLQANAAAKVNTASLLGGIYGGTATADGPGTTKAEIFGLGAWEGNVYGFARCYGCYDGGSNVPASLLQINPSTGAATAIGSPYTFTDGWSGAGVTTKVTVTVVAPPPTMPPK